MGDSMSSLNVDNIGGAATARPNFPDGLSITGEVVTFGTAAGNVVKLDGSSRLPAVDASLLTNLPVSTPIGEGQTWQDVFSNRTSGTTYQNTTGRPIMVSIFATGNIPSVEVSSNGTDWITIQNSSSNAIATCTIIVPNTWRYRSTGTLTRWTELR